MSACADDLEPLSSAQVKHLKAEDFAPVTTVAGLPAGVRTALETMFGGPPLSLADPDAPFSATDVITDQQLPGRRLIAAGCSQDHCLLHYERGGIAHVYYVALLTLSNGTSRLEFGGTSGRLVDLTAVKSALIANKVRPGARGW